MQNTATDGWLRQQQVFERYGCISRSGWLLIFGRGHVTSTKIGRMRIVRVSDVEAFLAGKGEVARAHQRGAGGACCESCGGK